MIIPAFNLDVYIPRSITPAEPVSSLAVVEPEAIILIATRQGSDVYRVIIDKEHYTNFNKLVSAVVNEIEQLGLGLAVEDVELDKANNRGAIIFKHNGSTY